jgi:hypothetical protein
MADIVGPGIFIMGVAAIVIYFIGYIVLPFFITLPHDTELDEMTAEERAIALNTTTKRVLYWIWFSSLSVFAIIMALGGFAFIISKASSGFEWATQNSGKWWFIFVALGTAYILYQMRELTIYGVLQMAVGAALVVTSVISPTPIVADGDVAVDDGLVRLIAILAGVYFLVEGMDHFRKHKSSLASLEWFGPLGIRFNGIWDIVIDWDTTAWKERNNYVRTYIKRAERRRRRGLQ